MNTVIPSEVEGSCCETSKVTFAASLDFVRDSQE
jgi:hypothetical protein